MPALNNNTFRPSNSFPASTSVSDNDGNLLFASDGKTIIDKELNIMPSIKNILFKGSNDKVLAFKIPGSSKYYVFYSSANDINVMLLLHCDTQSLIFRSMVEQVM